MRSSQAIRYTVVAFNLLCFIVVMGVLLRAGCA